MKLTTIKKLQDHMNDKRLIFNNDVSGGIRVDHDLSDDEVKEVVEIEYSQTSQDIHQLFEVILKNMIKEVLTYAKNNPDKLSDL